MTTIAAVTAKLEKKHPINYSISVSESTHCVMGHIVDGFVETEDEKLHYATDKIGRLRLIRRTKLTPTYKSVRLQPIDHVIRIVGGAYDGQYYVATKHDGYLNLTHDIAKAHVMRQYTANEVRNYIAFHAQHCYRGTFEIVALH